MALVHPGSLDCNGCGQSLSRSKPTANAFACTLIATRPVVLHIYSRQGMTAADTVALFFEGERNWNDQRRRFESRLGQRVLFWAWLYGEEGSTVIVLSCFDVQKGLE